MSHINENRIINFLARALGHLSAEKFHLSLAALEAPSGSYGDITVAQMAWDGSYFLLIMQRRRCSSAR